MGDYANLVYSYDGSFNGLLCCVYESYEKREIPMDILSPATSQITLFPVREIETNLTKARRVLFSISQKIGQAALDFVQQAFLTTFTQKELYILQFLRLGYRYGEGVMNMLSNNVVNTLFKWVNHLERESHLLKGFVRFSAVDKVLVAEIEPKNYVLPLLVEHFCQRYPEEQFLIYDRTHSMGLVYQPYQFAIIAIEDFKIPKLDEEEKSFRELWQLFYKTIKIEERHNPKGRMSHMPKRYWKHLTELEEEKD